MYLCISTLVLIGYSLCCLRAFVLINFVHQFAVVLLDFLHDVGTGDLAVWVQILKVGQRWLVLALLGRLGVLKLFFTDVDHIVGGFGQATAVGVFEDLLLLNDVDSVVIVLAPHSLSVVLDVAVVVTTLCSSIVDADTMKVVSLSLQRRVLILEQILLGLNLQLKAFDLVFDFVPIVVKHLLHEI